MDHDIAHAPVPLRPAGRLIAWARIVLPLLGLAILSSLFLFARSYSPEDGVNLLRPDIDAYTQDERITAPRFSGMTETGVTVQISAAAGRPRVAEGGGFDADELRARLVMPNGTRIDIFAPKGAVRPQRRQALLTGGITLVTSDGTTAVTKGLILSTTRMDARSQGQVVVTTPQARIEAGEMRLTREEGRNPDDPGGLLLTFKNGVKMIYTP